MINNQAEYEACIFRLEALHSVGAENITVYGNSMLVVKQPSKKWEVKEDRLRLYWDYLATIYLSFDQCKFVHLSREENQIVDALATLASMWESSARSDIRPLILSKSWSPYYEEVRVMLVQTVERSWFHNL